jgi:hypothetical protein
MNGRRAIVGLCMLCALVVSAFAAQSASATESKGTTAFTCKPVIPAKETKGFSKAHCKPEDAVNTEAKFEHVEIPESTTTKITGNNKDTEGKAVHSTLVSTAFGATVELTAKTLTGEGWMTNAKDPTTGEHYAHGEGTITYTDVTVVKPANCVVDTHDGTLTPGPSGIVHTEPLKATTKGQGDRLKFEPKEGTTFAKFWITGAGCPFNQTFTVTGSVNAPVDGATTNATEADTTSQNTLKLNGAKAGISGTLTIEGKDEVAKDTTYEPLSATTVETK